MNHERPSAAPCRLLGAISKFPVLLILIALYLVFVLFIFPNFGYDADAGPLDLKFSYSPDEAYETIESYGEEGRAQYALGEMTIDVVYPVVYTLMFSVWITLALNGASLSSAKRCLVSMSPMAVFVLDMFENAGIVAMLKMYPDRHDTLATATSFASSSKWSAAAFVILLTVGTTAHRVWRRISRH